LIQVRWDANRAEQTFAIESASLHPTSKTLELTMKVLTVRHALFLAAALAVAGLAGCAEVHQDPVSTTVIGQADASASQNSDAQPASATNIPF
jgi:hypothetical protein